MLDRSNVLVAEVCIKEEGGSIHAYSEEIPGLHIVGTEREAVLEDVVTGIKFLYKEVKNMNVDVRWVNSPKPVRDFERFMMTEARAA